MKKVFILFLALTIFLPNFGFAQEKNSTEEVLKNTENLSNFVKDHIPEGVSNFFVGIYEYAETKRKSYRDFFFAKIDVPEDPDSEEVPVEDDKITKEKILQFLFTGLYYFFKIAIICYGFLVFAIYMIFSSIFRRRLP